MGRQADVDCSMLYSAICLEILRETTEYLIEVI